MWFRPTPRDRLTRMATSKMINDVGANSLLEGRNLLSEESSGEASASDTGDFAEINGEDEVTIKRDRLDALNKSVHDYEFALARAHSQMSEVSDYLTKPNETVADASRDTRPKTRAGVAPREMRGKSYPTRVIHGRGIHGSAPEERGDQLPRKVSGNSLLEQPDFQAEGDRQHNPQRFVSRGMPNARRNGSWSGRQDVRVAPVAKAPGCEVGASHSDGSVHYQSHYGHESRGRERRGNREDREGHGNSYREGGGDHGAHYNQHHEVRDEREQARPFFEPADVGIADRYQGGRMPPNPQQGSPEAFGNVRSPEVFGNFRNPEAFGNFRNPEAFGNFRNPEDFGNFRYGAGNDRQPYRDRRANNFGGPPNPEGVGYYPGHQPQDNHFFRSQGRSERPSSNQHSRMKDFSGQDSTFTFEHFVHHVEALSAYNRWSEEDVAKIVEVHLIGEALDCVSDSPKDKNTWADLKDILHDHFRPEGREPLYRTQLYNRKCGKEETLAQYATALRQLTKLAFPGSNNNSQTQSILVDLFVKGQGSETFQELAYYQDIRTLNDALRLAEKAETGRKSMHPDKMKKPSLRAFDVKRSEDEMGEGVVARLESMMRTRENASIGNLADAVIAKMDSVSVKDPSSMERSTEKKVNWQGQSPNKAREWRGRSPARKEWRNPSNDRSKGWRSDSTGRDRQWRNRSESPNNNGRGRTPSRDRGDVQCFRCQGYGHFANDCPSPFAYMVNSEGRVVKKSDEKSKDSSNNPKARGSLQGSHQAPKNH